MFDPAFLDQLADVIAGKVIARIEGHVQKQSALSEWIWRYYSIMTREEVAKELKIIKRALINMEYACRLERANLPGREVKYETAKIFELATNRMQRYANR